MKTLRTQICATVITTLAGIGSAHAQAPTLSDPEKCPQPQANCPVAQAEPQPTEPQPAEPQPPPQTHTETTTTVVTPPAYEPTAMEEERPWYERMGFGLSLGGGVDGFVDEAAIGTDTTVGGSWNLRLTWGTKSPIAFEGSYIGSAQSIDAIGLDNDAVLVGNGAQGAVRVNFVTDYVAQPFLYGGAAWRHYELTNTNFNTSDVADSDDVFELPVGIGVAGYVAGFMADVRAEYRGTWDDDMFPSDNDRSDALISQMDRWGVMANIGAEF
jgi:hypothetical protein